MPPQVSVDGRVISKAGQAISGASRVDINATEPKYVCRGGLKLEHALQHFGIDVTGKVHGFCTSVGRFQLKPQT